MLHLVVAFSVLSAIEQCSYTTTARAEAGEGDDCTAANLKTCIPIEEAMLNLCSPVENTGGSRSAKITCSDGSVKMQYHAKQDCSDDASTECSNIPGSHWAAP